MDHRKWCQCCSHGSTHPGLHDLWVAVGVDWYGSWSVAVDNVLVVSHCGSRGSLSGLCFSCGFRTSWPLLARQILLGEALFPSLCFPVIVPDPPAICDDSASELTKHGLRGHDRNLSRPIRIRQYFLMDQVIFLRLRRDNFV